MKKESGAGQQESEGRAPSTGRASGAGQHLRILGSGILLGLVAWRLDWQQLGQAFAGLDLRFWVMAVGVHMVAQVVSSVRWQQLSVPLGFAMPWRHYLSFYFIGMFFNLLLPTSVGGDVVRAIYLSGGKQGSGESRPGLSRAMLSVFADRASGLAVLVVLACVAGLLAPAPLPNWMNAALIALGALLVVGLASLPALPLLGRLPLVGRRLGQVVDAGRVYLHRPGLLLWATLLSVVVQVASVVQVWLIGEGLGLDVPVGYMGMVVPLVTLLTLLPVSVSGVGLRELGMVVLLAPVGVSRAEAVTLSLLSFAVIGAGSLVGFGLYLSGRYPWSGSRQESAASRSIEPASGAGEQKTQEGRSDAEPVGGGPDQGRTRQSSTAA